MTGKQRVRVVVLLIVLSSLILVASSRLHAQRSGGPYFDPPTRWKSTTL